MQTEFVTPQKKALEVNLDPQTYGSLAEIGAGQEVARHFFLAGKASQTIAKTMSAYDMTFSDAIYGSAPNKRYVCEARVKSMVDHEYELLIERLKGKRGKDTRFFAFADTVATGGRNHGWLAVKFQARPLGEANTVVLHVQLQDKQRLQQQEALGILGVNLIHSALNFDRQPFQFVNCLTECLGRGRIEIDMIRFSGPDLQHVDNRLISLYLVQKGLTQAVLFGPEGDVMQPADAFFNKSVFVQRGTFRPITSMNLEIQNSGLRHFLEDFHLKDEQCLPMVEMTIPRLEKTGGLDARDFLDRVETLSALGIAVIISDFFLFYELKSFIRRFTELPIGLVIGAAQLPLLMDEEYYLNLPGGILEAFGRLGGEKTCLYVFPYQKEGRLFNCENFVPGEKHRALYQYLLDRRFMIDVKDAKVADDSIHSDEVRKMMEEGDETWQFHVPEQVAELVREKGYFIHSKK